MQPSPETMVMLAVFNLGGGEIILILATVLILFGADKLPPLFKGLGIGLRHFWNATDEAAHNAGRSVGGIYGKPAFQPLTPDNEVAELYDPTISSNTSEERKSQKGLFQFVRTLWSRLCIWFSKSKRETTLIGSR
jgi:TatA/E family protein of Tat protein translocase